MMKPSVSLMNFTPTSTAFVSAVFTTMGTADGLNRVVQGQLPATTRTVTTGAGASILPLSSTARLRIVAAPRAPGDQSKLQVEVPRAARHVAPPSTETST